MNAPVMFSIQVILDGISYDFEILIAFWFFISVNSYALILVTPPRSIQVQILQELHLDDSITIYPLEKGDQLPEYISEAIHFCQQWYSG